MASPRLRFLAMRQMGLPLSQWIIRRKLEQARNALAHGASLSDAALTDGFADQAHLTRSSACHPAVLPGCYAPRVHC